MEEKGRIYPAPIELAPTKDEVQCNWYAPSNDYFMWYVPRSPPVSIGGLYGEYMNKRSAARTAKKKSSEDLHPSECDDGNVYCYDDNGDVPLFFMPAKPVSQQTDQDLSSDLSALNELCSLSQTGEEKGDCEHYKYTYSSKQEDQIIRLVDQRQQDHFSNMTEVSEQKIQSEIQRLYNHREARLNKIAEEDKQRKCLGHMNSSAHMKLAIERCVPKKRKYVDVLRSPFCELPKILNVPSIEQLANQKNDLSRPFKRIDKNFLSHELQVFLSRVVMGRCKFPWCNDIIVDRSFWNGLCALDDNHKEWLLDEHIDLWVTYLWLTRQTDMDWAMVNKLKAGNTKNIDPAKYKISFKVADGFPKQGGVFGDCGVFLCIFLYRLANGIPLALDDPLQSALAYWEKLIHFYFKHKMFCP
ncbi:phospholipase-like protein [Tanacetum coccineum]